MTEARPQRYDVRRAVLIGVLLSVAIAAYVQTFNSEDSLFPLKQRPGVNYPLRFWSGTAASVALGMGLGSLLTLYLSNRHRLGAVLRPNLGRVICAVVFALVLPIWQFWGIPLVLGYLMVRTAGTVAAGLSDLPLGGLGVIGIGFLGLLASYFISSLIISGAHARLVRIALFGQIWLAFYAATMLAVGVYIY